MSAPFIRIPAQTPLRLLVSSTGRPYFVPLHPEFEGLREKAPYELIAYVLEHHIGPGGRLNCDPPASDVAWRIESRDGKSGGSDLCVIQNAVAV